MTSFPAALRSLRVFIMDIITAALGLRIYWSPSPWGRFPALIGISNTDRSAL